MHNHSMNRVWCKRDYHSFWKIKGLKHPLSIKQTLKKIKNLYLSPRWPIIFSVAYNIILIENTGSPEVCFCGEGLDGFLNELPGLSPPARPTMQITCLLELGHHALLASATCMGAWESELWPSLGHSSWWNKQGRKALVWKPLRRQAKPGYKKNDILEVFEKRQIWVC